MFLSSAGQCSSPTLTVAAEDIEMLKGLAPEEGNVLNKFGKVALTESEVASIQHLGLSDWMTFYLVLTFFAWRRGALQTLSGRSSIRLTRRWVMLLSVPASA